MSTERIAKCSITGAYSTNKMREVQIQLADGEVRDKVEHYEPFGFTSEMIADGKTDSVVVFTDESRGLGMVVCAADRRYRPTDLKPGEVCVYDKKGRKVYFKEDGIVVEGVDDPITINTTAKVVVNAPTVEVNSETVQIKASSLTKLDTPETTVTGHMTVQGGITVSGGGGSTMTGDFTLNGYMTATEDITAGTVSLQHHTHNRVQPGSGNTGEPNA